jgi:hypothetical protein
VCLYVKERERWKDSTPNAGSMTSVVEFQSTLLYDNSTKRKARYTKEDILFGTPGKAISTCRKKNPNGMM